jgi:phage FluMu gp28-like protein
MWRRRPRFPAGVPPGPESPPSFPALGVATNTGSAPAPRSPWNLYFRVTLLDAIQFRLVHTINRARGTNIPPDQFLADCRARARNEETFEQSYLCNPMGAAASHIVEWSAIERCCSDYNVERAHLEADQVRQRFGEFVPCRLEARESQIKEFLRDAFHNTLTDRESRFRLGFDVAASGQGDLSAIYIDNARGDELWLRALFTCRTEDWHFLKTVLFCFLKELHSVQAAGDESGLGRQICWEAAKQYPGRFLKVNFASKKHDLGFALMNQLSLAQKRFPRGRQDVAADYFALRKVFNAGKWAFSEGRNCLNPSSHCDLAWAGALATCAHTWRACQVYAAVVCETGWLDIHGFHPFRF